MALARFDSPSIPRMALRKGVVVFASCPTVTGRIEDKDRDDGLGVNMAMGWPWEILDQDGERVVMAPLGRLIPARYFFDILDIQALCRIAKRNFDGRWI